MCGLAGLLTANGARTDVLTQHAQRMGATLHHRGPDDEGVWVDAEFGIGLAFRRLSIVDLSAEGHQPMQSASGRFAMTFNGEVYNHVELARELRAQGASFRGHSDTEVILAAFEAWGVAVAVKRFVGMFAIAVWDRERHQLHLIRDRLGIKPLFVYWRAGTLLWGSELKALLAHPDLDASIDRSALASYLRYLYVPAPRSILNGVFKLQPGHVLSISDVRVAPPAPVPFWSAEAVAQSGRRSLFTGTDKELIDELGKVLTRAVDLRMRADVPVGAFLSGGIDSTLVVALMQQCTPQPVRTFTIGFEQPEWNEAPYAADIARHLGTAHTDLTLSSEDLLSAIPSMPHMFDEPLADPSQIPTYLVSRLARQDVTVALSGDGGDELFAGYNRYLAGPVTMRRAARVPLVLRRGFARAVHSKSPRFWDDAAARLGSVLPGFGKVRLVGDKLHKLADLMTHDSQPAMYRSLLSQWQNPGSALLHSIESTDLVERVMAGYSDFSTLDRMMLSDQLGYLPDDLLAKVDRASMAVSLEVRVPLIDHNVVEFSWRVPDSARVRNGQSKWPLRQLLDRYVPRSLIERPKMGFSVPMDQWLRGPLRDWADDLLDPTTLHSDGIFQVDTIVNAWSSVRRGQSRAGMALWSVLVFQAWQQQWLGSMPAQQPTFATVG